MSNKRGNNAGSIIKRSDGRWEARMSLPDGKRKSYYAKTQAEAQRKLNEALRNKDQGLLPGDDRQTVAQYLNFWLESRKHQLTDSSYLRYQAFLKNILPELGRLPLSKLTAQVVQAFLAKKINAGVAATSVRAMRTVIKSAMKDAVDLGIIHTNVIERVKSPRIARRQTSTLSEEQVRQLLLAAKGDRLEALYTLAVTTGMREGELLALRWKDVDLERHLLWLRANLQNVAREKGRYRVSDTKTSSSRRSIALSQHAIDTLHQRKFIENKEKEMAGDLWKNEDDLIFPTEVGKWIYPQTFKGRIFARLLTKAGLPKMRFHDLRHTAATLLLIRGVNPKVVSEMLGHASVAITLDVYSHVTPHMQQIVADVMDKILDENP